MSNTLNRLKSVAGKVDTGGFNWTAVIIWGALIGGGVFALWYYRIEPVYGWMVSAGSWVDSVTQNLTSDLDLTSLGNQISEYVKANPLIAITGVISVAGGALALYERSQRIKEQNLKLAEQEAKEYANLQKSAVTDDLAYYKQKAETAEGKLASIAETNISQQYETAKTELLQEQTKVQTLEKQLQEAREQLTNTPVKVVEVVK